MLKRIVGALVGFIVVLLALLVAGMRWKLAPVLNTVRRINHTVTNPRVMRTAGTAGTQTSVIQHVGRKSGRAYETPVDVVATPSGFVIALPYGTHADWLLNVLRAGSATVVTNGERVDVESPTVVATADVADLIPNRLMRTLRMFGVNECVRLDRVSAPS
jgi:deazaflavin-dependent oxidoreductase (nitroreductase family)